MSDSKKNNANNTSSTRHDVSQSDIYKAFQRSQQSDHLNELAQLNLDDPEHPAVHLMHVQRQNQIGGDLLQRQAALNDEAAHFFELASNSSTDPTDIANLQFLSQHFQDQARFKRSLGHHHHHSSSSSSSDSNHRTHVSNTEIARSSHPLSEKVSAIGGRSDGNSGGGDDDSVSARVPLETISHVSSSQQSPPHALQALSNELKNLFLVPWEMLYTQEIEPLPSSIPQADGLKESFMSTLQKTQRSYRILMDIVAQQESGISGRSSGGNSGSSSPISDSNDIAQRLNSLNTSLASIQIARLQSHIAKLDKSLEQERKVRAKYQKDAKKYKKRFERLKQSDSGKAQQQQQQQQQQSKPNAQ